MRRSNEHKTVVEVSKSTRDRIKKISANYRLTMQGWLDLISLYEWAKILTDGGNSQDDFNVVEFIGNPKDVKTFALYKKLRDEELMREALAQDNPEGEKK